jgi:hypothetical protein
MTTQAQFEKSASEWIELLETFREKAQRKVDQIDRLIALSTPTPEDYVKKRQRRGEELAACEDAISSAKAMAKIVIEEWGRD